VLLPPGRDILVLVEDSRIEGWHGVRGRRGGRRVRPHERAGAEPGKRNEARKASHEHEEQPWVGATQDGDGVSQ
jgi:hypothetical protein